MGIKDFVSFGLSIMVLAGLSYFLVKQVILLIKECKLRQNKKKTENLKKEEDK
jgi:hypothetical protein